jgi:hypothetical protein
MHSRCSGHGPLGHVPAVFANSETSTSKLTATARIDDVAVLLSEVACS